MPAVKVKQTEKQWDRLVKRSEAIKAKEYQLVQELIAHGLRLPKMFPPSRLKGEVRCMANVARRLSKVLKQADDVCEQLSDLVAE